MGKKIFRVVGYFFCGALIILCVVLIIAAAVFGSRKTVDVFGYNIYITETDGFESAPNGSALLVKKCGAVELKPGNLVLWSDPDGRPSLGYVREISLSEGVYSLKLNAAGKEHIIAESRVIGHAEYSSMFLGRGILFMRSPVGVFFIAVLPCVALILFEIIRASVKNRPEPEVEPLFKNVVERAANEQQQKIQNRTINVNSDGKASYNRKKPANTAAVDRVLFEPGKSRVGAAAPKRANPGALPSDSARLTELRQTAVPKNYPESSKSAENRKNAAPLVTKPSSDKTTELTRVPARDSRDAFFAQTSAVGRQKRTAPQIGKASENEVKRASESASKPIQRPAAGRKSSQILASKNIDDLISDDDDYRDASRVSNSVVDDILADIKKRERD